MYARQEMFIWRYFRRTNAIENAGLMVEKWWRELQNKYPNSTTDCFVVMPNHFHGIIIINSVGADLRVCPNKIETGKNADLPLQYKNSSYKQKKIIVWI